MPHIAEESAISFTPDHSGTWAVRFSTKDNKSWTEPVIGWAVVVIGDDGDDDRGAVVTQIQPVVIDPTDGWPSTVTEYRNNREGYVTWGVIGR